MDASLTPSGSRPPGVDREVSEATSKTNEGDAAPSPPSWLKRVWGKMGLKPAMLKTMFKGASPPIIATALYQANSFANTFSTLGYLVAIMSILSFAILPRSKFFQTMTFNVIGVCVGASIALLTIYCAVQARIHTTPTSATSPAGAAATSAAAAYNSSASAVCAIWLFVNICFANALRFSRPQLQFPVIIYSIFANVACTYAPQFPTMTEGIAFVKELLEAFLTGFAIAAGVNVLVFPQSSRDVLFGEATAYIAGLQAVLKTQNGYLKSLERKEMFQPVKEKKLEEPPLEVSTAKEFKEALAALTALHGKMLGDLTFAKREIAYSYLNAKDLDKTMQLFRAVFLPLIGMGSVVDIFERIAERRGWKQLEVADESVDIATKERIDMERAQWNEIMKTLQKPVETMSTALIEGLQHTSYTLRLTTPPKSKQAARESDPELGIASAQPGDRTFGQQLAQRIRAFHDQRETTLRTWAAQKGFDLCSKMNTDPLVVSQDTEEHSRNQRQLYVILYMGFLLWSTGNAVLDLVRFADAMVETGVMKKRRLLLPGRRRLRKWFMGAFNRQDSTTDIAPDNAEAGIATVYLGSSFQRRKDPEHLPPTNKWQSIGDSIRTVSHVMASQELSFGFRVACGTLSIGILAYLEATQTFFFEQRLVWAMIMVAIGMTMTAGSGVFGLIGRTAGTFVATCTSLVIWYIAGRDGAPAGVLVVLWAFLFVQVYFLVSFPKFTVVVMITMVTQVLILGYELQVEKIGIAASSASGQPYYPIYELAPYRLATVAAGCFVAFFWTFFPYPLTARSTLRRQLGESLYLLANFYSCVHTTVQMRILGNEGDVEDKKSPGRRLKKMRDQLLSKELALIGQLRQHSASTAFEPVFGGKFPKKEYDTIIGEVQNILQYMALVGYATRHFTKDTDSPTDTKWVSDFGRVLGSVDVTSQEVTSLLSLLSASVLNGSPLPPYLKVPASYQLIAKLEKIDADILNISHICEPGYASFAVTQVASSLINDDLEKLVKNVKNLVGEVDFDFHIISSTESLSGSASSEQEKGKQD